MTKKSELNFPCIYLIRNTITNDGYIGQAFNTRKRWSRHTWALQRNIASQHLQRAWNKYGSTNFTFEILADLRTVSPEQIGDLLNKLEIEYMNNFEGDLYNLKEGGMNGRLLGEATKQILSAQRIELWKDPAFRAKRIDAFNSYWARPGVREERGAILREALKDPVYKAHRKELTKQMWEPGGVLRETQSAIRKANWQDPVYRKKQSASRQETWKDPEVREKRIAGMKESYKDPIAKQNRIDKVTEANRKPEARKKASEKFIKLWSDTAKKAAAIEKRKQFYADPVNKAAHKAKTKLAWDRRKAREKELSQSSPSDPAP